MSIRILNLVPNFTDSAKKILDKIGSVDYADMTQEQLKQQVAHYHAIITSLGVTFDKDVFDSASQLQVLATPTTGLDHIDMDAAQDKGVAILSLRGETEFLDTITGTAELAWGLMIDIMRKMSHSFFSVKKENWKRENFRGHTLQGKTLGLIGHGRLGKMMARYARAFDMKVIVYDPYVENAPQHGEMRSDFRDLLKNSDIISIHVHLNDETRAMINADSFGRMKKSAYLINTSRGEIVNEKDLLNALEEGLIAGYAADVLSGELSFDTENVSHPLIAYAQKSDNCIIVPHIGGVTHESREKTDMFIAQKIESFYKTSQSI